MNDGVWGAGGGVYSLPPPWSGAAGGSCDCTSAGSPRAQCRPLPPNTAPKFNLPGFVCEILVSEGRQKRPVVRPKGVRVTAVVGTVTVFGGGGGGGGERAWWPATGHLFSGRGDQRSLGPQSQDHMASQTLIPHPRKPFSPRRPSRDRLI